jgi:dihydrofolate synthase/folylpolyglutamate synthase
MNYQDAIDYLLSFTDYEKLPGIAYTAENYDLRRMEALLSPLGNPHLGTGTIHIAGTKGKGSTAAMISSILAGAGYKTGLYTSPHLHVIRERVRINDEMISEEDFASLVTEIEPIAAEINRKAENGLLTTFELLTAVVFTYFKRNRVAWQVLETGLGGRLDATNVARGDICIITSISLDHMEILGDTVEKIAVEKAGIIKHGSIVINFTQPGGVTGIIEEACRSRNAVLFQMGNDITWKRSGGNLHYQSVDMVGNLDKYNIELPLLGDFQMENAAAAVLAAEIISEKGNSITKQQIISGIAGVNWPGRMHILSSNPLIVADGAHNAYSIRVMAESVKKYFRSENYLVILGTSIDKDIPGIANGLAGFTQKIIATRSTHPRAASIDLIKKAFSKYDITVAEAENVPQAIAMAKVEAGEKDLILITGSLFIVGEAISYLKS